LSWTVEVDFRKSSVHGTGVFAHRPIAAGTRIWQVDRNMHACDRETMYALSPRKLRFALHGGYYHKPSGKFLWYTDGMQYMNHAATPMANIGLTIWPPLSLDHTIALRDIEAGEELFEDYTFWADGGLSPDHWLGRLYREHCPAHYDFLYSLESVHAAAA
jgi:uncharacterized protein